jgi:Ca2+-binding EF-hand superfamily protein
MNNELQIQKMATTKVSQASSRASATNNDAKYDGDGDGNDGGVAGTIGDEETQELIAKCVADAFSSSRNIATEGELTEQAQLAVTNFRLADKDLSGTISFDELPALCSFMGLPLEQDEEEMLFAMDKDASGVLELPEWLEWWLGRVSCLPNPLAQQEALARNVFKKFDRDGSRGIDTTEINELFVSLGATFTAQELAEALHVLDADESGIVDEDEFVAWWMNRVSTKRRGGGMIALKLKRLAAKASQIFSTDIFTAVWKNDDELVQAFVHADKRIVNSCDLSEFGGGWMPLHYACYRGNENIVNELLNNGAKINGTNNDGFTPLFYAVQQGNVDICAKLLDSGADPTAAGKFIQMNNDNSVTTKDIVSKCPVDVSVLYPSILAMLKAHPKCRPPVPLTASQFSASLSRKGLFTVELPLQRTYSAVPVRNWVIQIFPASKDESEDADSKDTKGSESKLGNRGYMTFNIPSKAPSEDQQIVVALQRAWMKEILGYGQDIHLRCRLAAVDAFRDTAEYSCWTTVDYSPPVTASEKKTAEENVATDVPDAGVVETPMESNLAESKEPDFTVTEDEEELRVLEAKSENENENNYSHNFDIDG